MFIFDTEKENLKNIKFKYFEDFFQNVGQFHFIKDERGHSMITKSIQFITVLQIL